MPGKNASTIDQSVNRSIKEIIICCQGFCLSILSVFCFYILPGFCLYILPGILSLCCQGFCLSVCSTRDSVSLYCQEFCLYCRGFSLFVYTSRNDVSLDCQGFCLSILPGILSLCTASNSINPFIFPSGVHVFQTASRRTAARPTTTVRTACP